jgi:hypothetical protein
MGANVIHISAFMMLGIAKRSTITYLAIPKMPLPIPILNVLGVRKDEG